jgi:hypothetical protein
MFQIDDGPLVSKKSPFKQDLAIGEHNILVKSEYCDSLYRKINVMPHQDTVSFKLIQPNFKLSLNLRAPQNDTYSLYLDGKKYADVSYIIGFEKDFMAGDYELILKRNFDKKTVYKTRLKHPSRIKNKKLWLPSWGAWSLGSVNFVTPTSFKNKSSISFDFMKVSVAGLTLKIAQIEQFSSPIVSGNLGDALLVSFLDPEFRIGASITNWCDFSLFVNGYQKVPNTFVKGDYYYSANSVGPDTLKYEYALKNLSGFKYGIALNIFPHSKNRWAWASMTIRMGMRNESLSYSIKSVQNSITENKKIQENSFFISLSMNLLTKGDGMVLRVMRRPLAHLGGY